MSSPLFDLFAALLLGGAIAGVFLGRHRRVRAPLAVGAALICGATAAVVLAGEAARLTFSGHPSRPGALLAAAGLVAVTPAVVLGLRVWLRTATRGVWSGETGLVDADRDLDRLAKFIVLIIGGVVSVSRRNPKAPMASARTTCSSASMVVSMMTERR